jgi:hypothetical protein
LHRGEIDLRHLLQRGQALTPGLCRL